MKKRIQKRRIKKSSKRAGKDLEPFFKARLAGVIPPISHDDAVEAWNKRIEMERIAREYEESFDPRPMAIVAHFNEKTWVLLDKKLCPEVYEAFFKAFRSVKVSEISKPPTLGDVLKENTKNNS